MTLTSPLMQLFWLFTLALPVACIVRTFIFEELCRELHEFCASRSKTAENILGRKFFYLLTCDYCFSHYISLFFIVLMQFKLLVDDWRGYVIAFFALVMVSNVYLSLYARMRLELKHAKVETKKVEQEVGQEKDN